MIWWRWCRRLLHSVNEVQLVGSQTEEPIVTMYDWAEFFELRVKKIPLITSYHHFEFESTSKGKVTIREYNDTSPSKLTLTNSWLFRCWWISGVITPSGLSLKRQWYLYNKIRNTAHLKLKTSSALCLQHQNSLHLQLLIFPHWYNLQEDNKRLLVCVESVERQATTGVRVKLMRTHNWLFLLFIWVWVPVAFYCSLVVPAF